ncbi:MAG TPA: NAD(P)H-binding protein, partial [Candidatus Methanoperedens sp.]|nr:NAD(P)H-binding protein [Candidatus Methanoperedens sp.]
MILLTGATGFIGSRVLQALTMKNLKVRCLVRKQKTSQNPNITYVIGDVLDSDSLISATAGVETVYYFIHMMGNQPKGEQKKFDVLDRIAIENMVEACK